MRHKKETWMRYNNAFSSSFICNKNVCNANMRKKTFEQIITPVLRAHWRAASSFYIYVHSPIYRVLFYACLLLLLWSNVCLHLHFSHLKEFWHFVRSMHSCERTSLVVCFIALALRKILCGKHAGRWMCAYKTHLICGNETGYSSGDMAQQRKEESFMRQAQVRKTIQRGCEFY